MLTLFQVIAIINLLTAFGVDTATINEVHDILVPQTVSAPLPVGSIVIPPRSIEVFQDEDQSQDLEETTVITDQVKYLISKVDTQILDTGAKLSISKKQVTSSKDSCQGDKSSNGCQINTVASHNVSVYGSVLAQLNDRKERLIKMLTKLQDGGITLLTSEDKSFINNLLKQ